MRVTLIDRMGSDLSVVNSARVSFGKESEWEYKRPNPLVPMWKPMLSDKDEKLIRYLAKHEHFSPFNHTYITMHVKAPIFVARQLVKHEYMPWNEISRRYVDSEPELYEPEWRERAENVKQGSGGEMVLDDTTDNVVQEAQGAALRAYKVALRAGVAPEQARALLPQNTYTEWYWSGTLKAWAKMYNLRIDAHAQKETQEIARQAGEIIQPLFPVSWEALTDG